MGDLIDAAVTRLEAFPESGRSGRQGRTRELVIPGSPYLAIYRIFGSDVQILRFLHGAQEWPPRRKGRR
jgi:toxin ParE1/3/4